MKTPDSNDTHEARHGPTTSGPAEVPGGDDHRDIRRDAGRARLASLLGTLLAAQWLRGQPAGSSADRDRAGEPSPQGR